MAAVVLSPWPSVGDFVTQFMAATLTTLARKLGARALTEGVVLGDWAFQLGASEFDPLNPTVVEAVDPDAAELASPLGSPAPLGRVISSGSAATLTVLGGGVVQVDGISGVDHANGRYLTVLGKTWLVREKLSSSSVQIYAPLVTESDEGPLDWEFRELGILRPNSAAIDFHCRVGADEYVGEQINDIAIFSRIISVGAPLLYPLPVAVGERFLFALARRAPISKNSNMRLNFHVCVQA